LKEFDVICFQEVFSAFNSRRDRLIDAALEQGFKYHAVCPNPDFLSTFVVDGGLMILSKYPIKTSKFLPYRTAGVMSDCLALKGALYAKI
jgi:endonuclease/exonuclease/phosphatase family metal-dependent hydrolase